ncbi:MAG TPA: pyridoxamine 5'-phosphate oxidase family protein [Candidatus Omnitrophota bacterium]|nr:pyridoxamine 5'-phosphate oxidase family protein [Candidatus Omnitrophota bacterium]
MLIDAINKLLKTKEFVLVATSNLDAKPNVAPKLLIKIDRDFIYLADYVVGKTWQNLKVNPFASISFIDFEHLIGYQVNGSVDLLTSREEFDAILKDIKSREVSLTVKRIVEGIQRGKKHSHFEFSFPKKGVVFKVKIEEVVEITSNGKVQREKV